MNARRRAAEPTLVKGQRIVRLREVRTSMPPFVMVTWAVSDLHSPAKLFTHWTREGVARWATAQGYRYIGTQEAAS